MMSRTRDLMRAVLPFLLAALVVTAACNRSQTSFGIPTSPSAPSPMTPPAGAARTATPIDVGQTVRATVTLADAPCETDFDPCLRYAIVPSVAGLLRIQLSSPGPSELALRIGGGVHGYTVDRIERTVSVSAGITYEVSVALHYAMAGNTGQLFELTTSLAPR